MQPFVALGRGLIQQGHRVTLAAPEPFATFVTENDLEFAPLTDALIALMDDRLFASSADPKSSPFRKVTSLIGLGKKARGLQDALLDDIFASFCLGK